MQNGVCYLRLPRLTLNCNRRPWPSNLTAAGVDTVRLAVYRGKSWHAATDTRHTRAGMRRSLSSTVAGRDATIVKFTKRVHVTFKRSQLGTFTCNMTADIDGRINAIFMTGDLVSLLKVIQSDEDGEASWSSMTITHLVYIVPLCQFSLTHNSTCW